MEEQYGFDTIFISDVPDYLKCTVCSYLVADYATMEKECHLTELSQTYVQFVKEKYGKAIMIFDGYGESP